MNRDSQNGLVVSSEPGAIQRASWDFNSLDPAEQAVANAIWSPLFVLCQEMFFARKRTIEAADVSYQQDVIVATFLQMPGLAMWWEYANAYLAPEFRDYAQRLLESPDCPRPNHELLPWYVDRSFSGGSGNGGSTNGAT